MPEVISATEEVVKAEEATEVKADDSTLVSEKKEIKSGMQRSLDRYINAPRTEETSTEKPVEKPVEKKFDYTVFKDLDDNDYKKFEHLKQKDEATYYELMSHRNDVKKNQRLVAVREKEINELKNKSNAPEDVQKMREFISSLKKDAYGTYKQYQKDFDLPDIEFFEKQMNSGGGIEDRLVQWQESDLIPTIEKKFKLESNTFVYDANEAFKAGTPSYEFRIQTEKREKEMSSEYDTIQTRQRTILSKVQQQNDADLKYLRETFYPNSEFVVEGDTTGELARQKADEAFGQSLAELDEIQKQIREGEFDPTLNPFALRNIWRGINYDKLLSTAIERVERNLHAQYNAKGLYLAKEDMPTDISKVKGKAPEVSSSEPKKHGMLHKRIANTLSQ